MREKYVHLFYCNWLIARVSHIDTTSDIQPLQYRGMHMHRAHIIRTPFACTHGQIKWDVGDQRQRGECFVCITCVRVCVRCAH